MELSRVNGPTQGPGPVWATINSFSKSVPFPCIVLGNLCGGIAFVWVRLLRLAQYAFQKGASFQCHDPHFFHHVPSSCVIANSETKISVFFSLSSVPFFSLFIALLSALSTLCSLLLYSHTFSVNSTLIFLLLPICFSERCFFSGCTPRAILKLAPPWGGAV